MKVLFSLLALAYAVSPYDLFPDFFVGVGWIDDLIVLGLLWWYLYVYKKKRGGSAGHNPGRAQFSQGKDTRGRASNDAFEPKDSYSVLGLQKGASSKEIKQAYLRLANKYHPDKVMHLGEEFKNLAESRFKEIQGAYQELKLK